MPYDDVNRCLARTKVFVNTSDVEGFPNTFLQAWARKVPVVSYFDPDGIIRGKGLGYRPDDEADMCRALRELLSLETTRIEIGEKAHSFVLTQYSAESAAKRYLELCEA
jgi:glycosyltransferase involved in cell wall biosynthesis